MMGGRLQPAAPYLLSRVNMATVNSKRVKTIPLKEVLTLEEAACYFRVSEKILRRLAEEGAIPARKLGEEWRFLKSALQDWLARNDEQSYKKRLLKLAGAWKDDPTLDDMVKDIYRRRKEILVGDIQ